MELELALPQAYSNGDALIDAVTLYNNPLEIQRLIELGVDLNFRAEDGYTALNNAVVFKKDPITRLLLAQPSVDVNIPSKTGFPPAYFAHKYNHFDILESIIKHPSFDLEYNLVLMNDTERYAFKEYLHSLNNSPLPFLDAYQQTKLFAMKYEFNDCITFKHVNLHHYPCFETKGYANRLGASAMADSYEHFYDMVVSHSDIPMWAQTAFTEVNESLQFSASHFEPNSYYERYKKGETVIVPSGWDGHSIVFVVCEDKLYRCNRGGMSDGIHGIEEFIITNPSNLSVEIFDIMLQAKGSPDFLQLAIVDYLGLQKIGEIENPVQIMGNCVWTSLEAGVEAAFLNNFLKVGLDNQYAHYLAKQSFLLWEEFDLNHTLIEAIENQEVLNYYEIFDNLVVNVLENHHNPQSQADILKGVIVLEQLHNPLVFESFDKFTNNILTTKGLDTLVEYDDFLNACVRYQEQLQGSVLNISEMLDLTNVKPLESLFSIINEEVKTDKLTVLLPIIPSYESITLEHASLLV